MTVHTTAVVQPRAVELSAIVDRARMSGVDVTPLAEKRELRHECSIVRGPVRIMACGATFANRCMFPQEGAPLLRMARCATLVQCVPGGEEPYVLGPVWIVTGRALDLPFPHGHVT